MHRGSMIGSKAAVHAPGQHAFGIEARRLADGVLPVIAHVPAMHRRKHVRWSAPAIAPCAVTKAIINQICLY